MIQAIIQWSVLLPVWRRLISSRQGRIAAATGTGLLWIVIIIAISASSGGGDDESDGIVGGSTATPTATASPTPGATPAATATQTSEPTSTIAPTASPAPTLAPTPTPTPAPTPSPCPSRAESAYFNDLGEHIVSLGDAYGGMNILMKEAGRNVAVMLNEDWIIAMALQMFQVNTFAESILALDAPPSTSSISGHARNAAGESISAVNDWSRGIDNLDAGQIYEGAAHATNVGVYLERMNESLLVFCEG